MKRLATYFLRGLAVIAPLAINLYVCERIFRTIDGWLGLRIPGAGFVVTVVVITLVGFALSNFIARQVVSALDSLLERLPFVRLLYGATRDLLNAIVGEHRRFSRPVVVTLQAGGDAKALGFVTGDSLTGLGLADHVPVYFPHSYNFSGMLLLFPASRVTPITADSADVMAFVVSGGVAGLGGSRASRRTPTPPLQSETQGAIAP